MFMSHRDLKKVFNVNFLTSVACEIRFPPLLIIKEKISKFQKEIRSDFPQIQKGIFPTGFGVEDWVFISNDNQNKLRVTTDRLSFITTSYNDFKPYYKMISDNLKKFFKTIDEIDVLSRIGLRYTNDIPINDDNPLEDIIKWFNTIIFEKKIKDLKPNSFSVEMRIPKGNNIISYRNHYSLGINNTLRYIIDIDSYTEREINKEKAESIINELHDLVIKEFHNNIKDEFLHVLGGEK